MKLKLVIKFIAVTLLFLSTMVLLAQSDSSATRIHVEYSDIAEGMNLDSVEYRRLIGDVILKQDSTTIFCDTAMFDILNNEVIADGHVIITHGDSIEIFSDSLFYDGNTRQADLVGDVVLDNNGKKLFTEIMHYDMEKKIASYHSGALLVQDSAQLQSRHGYYYIDNDEIYFKDSVVIINPNMELHTDTLKYNTKINRATFLGPTRITQGDSKIYCESGYYDLEKESAFFTLNPQYIQGEKKVTADEIQYFGNKNEVILKGNAKYTENDKIASADLIRYDEKSDITYLLGRASYQDGKQNVTGEEIIYDAKNDILTTSGRSRVIDEDHILLADDIKYDKKTNLGTASGNVIWEDTISQIIIKTDELLYDKSNDYVKAIGERPLLISLIDGDSLYMTADTFLIIQDTFSLDSSKTKSKLLLGFNNVKVYKSDLQAICDSLVYSELDSMFFFYKNPIIWSDTSQFKGDTIQMTMKNKQLSNIFLSKKAFIINSSDEQFFNQISGRDINAQFVKNQLDSIFVIGNAQSIYYLQDEKKAYIAANKIICSEMHMDFGNNQILEIKGFPKPKASLVPMAKANDLKLAGFSWIVAQRPKSVEDLFKNSKKEEKDTTETDLNKDILIKEEKNE